LASISGDQAVGGDFGLWSRGDANGGTQALAATGGSASPRTEGKGMNIEHQRCAPTSGPSEGWQQ